MKFVIQFFFSFLDEKLFILYLSSSFCFIDIFFCFPVPYSIFLYYNSFYVVFFNMIYLPDYLNFYLNLILLCILFFYPTLLFFIKYFLFHIYLRSFFRGVTRYYHFHIETEFLWSQWTIPPLLRFPILYSFFKDFIFCIFVFSLLFL